MGPTGAGKSYFIDLLTGQPGRRARNTSRSVTQKVEAIRIECPGDPEGRSIVLVDTPGFDDTTRSDIQVLELISDWLVVTYENQVKLSGLIYLHCITDNRMAGHPYKNLRMFGELCGGAAMSQVLLVTTMWERLVEGREVGEARVIELKDKFWKPFIQRGSEVDALRKATSQDAWRVQEVVDCGVTLKETYAGQALYTDYQRKLAQQKQQMKSLLKKIEAMKGAGLENGALQEEYRRIHEEFEKTFAGAKTLKRSNLERLVSLLHFSMKQKATAHNGSLKLTESAWSQMGNEEATGGPSSRSDLSGALLVDPHYGEVHYQAAEDLLDFDRMQVSKNGLKAAIAPVYLTQYLLDRTLENIKAVERVGPDNLRARDTVVLVLGERGTGKSTFVQTALGTHYKTDEVKHDLISGTSEINAHRISFSDGKKPIVLVDTPGWDNLSITIYQHLENIVQWLNDAGADNFRTDGNGALWRVSGILYLHRITDDRPSGSYADNFALLEGLCGEDFYGRVFLTTTMWSGENNPIELEQEEKREQELKSRYWETMIAAGARSLRFTGTCGSAQTILQEIIRVERRRCISVTPISAYGLTKHDMIVVVMGPTGVGKSTFVQTVVKEHCRPFDGIGHELSSATSEVSAIRITFKRLRDRLDLVLVDTPGFGDTYRSDSEVFETIVNWLHGCRISGILYLHRITDTRLFGSIATNFELFEKLCGEDFYKHVILTTTMWPVENSSAYTPELRTEYEEHEKQLISKEWAIMIRLGSKVRRFTRTISSAFQILSEVVDLENEAFMKEQLPRLQIQSEMETGTIWETKAGQYIAHRILGSLQQSRRYPPPRLFRERNFETIDKVVPISALELNEDDMIIVVMGSIGAGKTTFIQTISSPQQNSDRTGGSKPPHSATTEVSAVRISFGVHDSSRLVLVDTPGYAHSEKDNLWILEKLALWFKNASAGRRRISGIIYLHSISDIGDSERAKAVGRNFKLFEKLCGKQFCNRVVIITTHWPSDERDSSNAAHILREQQLERDDWRMMIAYGAKVCRFGGTPRSVERAVNLIVMAERQEQEQLYERTVQIQKELVREFKTLPNTEAGQHLRSILKKLVEEQAREIKGLKKDLRLAGGLDPGLSVQLEQRIKEREANVKVVVTLKPRPLPLLLLDVIRR
ncbi:hypothetical protein NP233_g12077 [Leucocoprinus birnbaumii]|uniref:AAA+ ATPase domain-containing protein n=1 Tax=Leucocoprinus birnbaumii TaxID=56174 RepID=A0AAD5VF25_9AGAR|nr:hypothetical protein NP233_g12077 [Leucocoprinus birnbaumii]